MNDVKDCLRKLVDTTDSDNILELGVIIKTLNGMEDTKRRIEQRIIELERLKKSIVSIDDALAAQCDFGISILYDVLK